MSIWHFDNLTFWYFDIHTCGHWQIWTFAYLGVRISGHWSIWKLRTSPSWRSVQSHATNATVRSPLVVRVSLFRLTRTAHCRRSLIDGAHRTPRKPNDSYRGQGRLLVCIRACSLNQSAHPPLMSTSPLRLNRSTHRRRLYT